MNLKTYIESIKTKISQSPIINNFEIVDQRILMNRGYFRTRLILSNGDFLEIAESFKEDNNQCFTLNYRYQWMDGNKQALRKRWDSVEHFPNLPNFPHHVHIDNEFNVESSVLRNTLEIITLIEQEIMNKLD